MSAVADQHPPLPASPVLWMAGLILVLLDVLPAAS
jgi:hypothetical protein